MKYPISKVSLFLGVVCAAPSLLATTFNFVNLDPADYGFNDTTAVTPVGGNTGTTLGEQRINVVLEACRIWGLYLHSPVVIDVEGQFDDFGGDPDNGFVLAGARAIDQELNFTNAPLADVLYPSALANSLAGTDIDPAQNDISVTVNEDLDDPTYTPDLDNWYYGFDGNAPNDQVDLLDVVLHELGHGLGMATWCNLDQGSLVRLIGPGGGEFADIYATFLYDTEFNSTWINLSKSNRQASAVNDPDLVWTGPYTTAAKGSILDFERVIEVTGPAGIAGQYTMEPASFGPSITGDGITGELGIVDDDVGTTTDACEAIINDLTGKIAYIDRGTCNFDSKVLKAQQAGAIGVIIANNVADPAFIIMSGNSVVDGIPLTIPAVSITQADGAILTGATPPVNLVLGKPAGADLAGTNGGFVRIYAPSPWEQGSSGSHWSTAASPDLLMEPFINPVLREDLDLSLTQMKDIGWVVLDIPFPHLTYALWALEAFSPSATLTAQGEDPDGDQVTNIEEYFFGGDPEIPSADLLPIMQSVDPDLDVVYTRSILPTDLVYTYEASTDIGTWEDAVEGVHFTAETVTDLGSGAEQVKVNLIKPASGEKIFIRLRIEEI
ncbi:MAG: PA domain-containing protein [Puniceicoccaceae bacterium]